MPTDELIICTRNRPVDVAQCLESVATQTRIPTTVRIVDSSDTDETEKLVREVWTDRLAGVVVYQRAERGLTIQRNAGVRAGSSDIVHFIDDDVVLDPGYISAILDTFGASGNDTVLGVGGLVTNVHHTKASPFKRLFGLHGDTPGTVLRSGRNVMPIDLDRTTEVEWLSGCSMSFRRAVFDFVHFDEGLPGYGLGEDLDFTYNVRQFGRLVVEPTARLVHLQSPTNRLETAQYTRDELITRARRVRRRTGRLRARSYWWSVAGQTAALAVTSVSGPEKAAARQRLSATVRTAVDIAREGLSGRQRLQPTTLASSPPKVPDP